MTVKISDYSYNFPPNLVANTPAEPRDYCRLLVLNRSSLSLSHLHFYELVDLLTPNDVLVLNQTKVFPARLMGQKSTGGQVEVLLLRSVSEFIWEYISHPGLKPHTPLAFNKQITAIVLSSSQIQFSLSYLELLKQLDKVGQTPIPPYIHSPLAETALRQSYQTVYALPVGSAAAPTAGLHFTTSLLDKIKQKGIQVEELTLHVGLGTFQSLRPEQIESGTLHSEFFEIDKDTADNLNQAKKSGKRIIAVGTTTVRALESSITNGCLMSQNSSTNLFIHPPYRFQFVDGLITNFHLPESSLLMLVSSFTSHPNAPHPFSTFTESIVGRAYQTAIDSQYRLFSFGDAMLIV